jgi:hypothetical protein
MIKKLLAKFGIRGPVADVVDGVAESKLDRVTGGISSKVESVIKARKKKPKR